MNAGIQRLAATDADREGSLIERARAMDGSAWDALYTEHYQAVYRYAFYRVQEQVVAEDLAAEVFVAAVRGIRKYRYEGRPFRAWLYRIAHNVTADYRRVRAIRSPLEAPALAEGDPGDAVGDFAPGVLRQKDIQAALAKLSDDQQRVVVLRFFEGLNLAETALAMSRRENAIKQLQHRALTRLRAVLGEGH